MTSHISSGDKGKPESAAVLDHIGRAHVRRMLRRLLSWTVVPSRPVFGVLTERNFRLYFFGQLTSFIGTGMLPVALAFAVLARGGSTSQVGYVLGAESAPLAVFLLIGGVARRPLQRRLVMVGSDALRAVAQGVLALGSCSDTRRCGGSSCAGPRRHRHRVLHPRHDRAHP